MLGRLRRRGVITGFSVQPDALYFTVTALTTTGFGDIVLDLWFDAGMPSSKNRARFTSEFTRSVITQRVQAHALVTNSTLSRGVLTAINWVIKRPFQERVFAQPADGLAWIGSLKPDLDIGALRRDIEMAVPGFTSLHW